MSSLMTNNSQPPVGRNPAHPGHRGKGLHHRNCFPARFAAGLFATTCSAIIIFTALLTFSAPLRASAQLSTNGPEAANPGNSVGQSIKTIKIGVLAKRGKERCLAKWGLTADYLTRKIEGYSFEIVPLDFDEVHTAVRHKEVDFLLANSSLYVEMEVEHGISRIATLKNFVLGKSYTNYAGVIFYRADRTDIKELDDLRGKTFMAVDETSFGGWLMAWRELKEDGIDPHRDFADLQFGGTHDAVVYAVRDGKVDAGAVRSDTLERMEKEGKIRLDELRFLMLHDCPLGKDFPFVHSTRHYPEWPIAKLEHTSYELAEHVAAALMNMDADSPAARAANCAGWTVPKHYQSVRECLKELRVAPYEHYGEVTLADMWRQYWMWLVGSGIVAIAVLLAAIYVLRLNYCLRASISERKKVEEKYRRLFKGSRDALMTLEPPTWQFTSGNQAAVEMFHTGTAEKYTALGPWDLSPEFQPDGRPSDEKAKEMIETAMRVGSNFFKWQHKHLNGEEFPATVLLTRIDEEDHAFLLANVRDVTEQKRVEEAVQQSEEKYRALFDGASEGILVADSETRKFSYVNSAICMMLGYTEEELTGMGVADIHPGEDLEQVVSEFEAQSRGEKSLAPDIPCLRKDGSTFYADVNSAAVEINGRQCNVGFFTDITERKQAEEKLQKAYDQVKELEYIVNKSPAVAFLWRNDEGWPVEFVSDNALELFGYTAEEFTSGRVMYASIIHPGDLERVGEEVSAHSMEEGRERFEHRQYRIVAKDGTVKWVNDKTEIRRDEEGRITHYQGIVEDVTERKHAEDALALRSEELEIAKKKTEENAAELVKAFDEVKAGEEERMVLQEQFHQAQKMESIGLLAGGIAHDFNNLLQGILGYASMIRSNLNEDNEHYAHINLIEMTAERAADLTQQLLSFARKGRYDVVSVDTRTVAKEVIAICHRAFDKNIEVVTDYGENLNSISGDRSQIHQVLMNLCINAGQAMPEGGRLTIRVGNVAITETDRMGFEDANPGEYVMLTVQDTGTGMNEETLSRIFEPFFTTKELGEGTGLGLSIVFGVVQNHGGFIDVESRPGEGTTFGLLLPREEPKEENTTEPKTSVPEFLKRIENADKDEAAEKTILVVDDEEIVRYLASDMLQMMGHKTFTACDGTEAVEIYKEKGNEINLVLLDMMMPKMGGLETFRELKRINPSVKVIISSGYEEDKRWQNMMKEGAISFLKKPYLMENLAEAVQKASRLAEPLACKA